MKTIDYYDIRLNVRARFVKRNKQGYQLINY